MVKRGRMLRFEQLSIDIAQFRWLGKAYLAALLKSISLDKLANAEGLLKVG